MAAAILRGAAEPTAFTRVCDGFGVAVRRSTAGGGRKSMPSVVVHAVPKFI